MVGLTDTGMVCHTKPMIDIDPKITVKEALHETDGNQAELARKLGIGRASVNEYVREGREYLPELQGHRFVKIYRTE